MRSAVRRPAGLRPVLQVGEAGLECGPHVVLGLSAQREPVWRLSAVDNVHDDLCGRGGLDERLGGQFAQGILDGVGLPLSIINARLPGPPQTRQA
jgi:hypothetical protein